MSLRFRIKKAEAAIWVIAITATLLAGPFSLSNASATEGEEETSESTTTTTTTTIDETESSTTTTTTEPQNDSPESVEGAGFEDGTSFGWEKGPQSGTFGGTIQGNGVGLAVFSGAATFSHGPHGAIGSPTKPDGSENPYYAPAVLAGSWTFNPKNNSYALLMQPNGQQNFSQAMAALGLSGESETAIRAALTADAQAASNGGSPNPTDAAWVTREVELTAGVTYIMSWNYIGTDYVPFNDGSITSLVAVETPSTPLITVNNFERKYALLGFTNPGTGDYSVNSYGSTGWQVSTYEVSVTGTYKLGFTVFNLGDTALSPVLLVDNAIGGTQRCVPAGSNCETFGGVAPNNDTAPSVETVTTTTTTTVPETTVPETTVPETTIPDTTTTVAPAPVSPSPPSPTTEAPVVESPTTTEPQLIAPLLPKPPKPLKPTTTTTAPTSTTIVVPETSTTSSVPEIVEETDESDVEIPPATPETVTEEQKVEVAAAVSEAIESGVTSSEAAELVGDPVVLLSIGTEEAEQLFTAIDESALTEEAAAAIVVAVQNASEEIRKVFESAVDLFSGAFDDYKMVNQNISVGERRTLIAATVLMSTAAISITGPGSTPSSPSSSGPSNRQNAYARREDDEVEAAGEIAGDGLDWVRKIRIFNYENGVRTMNWKAFFTKFAYGIMNMGFTLAGSLVVYLTLSGPIQKIAGVSTVLAIAAAMWLHMKEPNDE